MNSDAVRTEKDQADSCHCAVHLAAFENHDLSVEAAEQLATLAKAKDLPIHKGRDLPTVARGDLLAQIENK